MWSSLRHIFQAFGSGYGQERQLAVSVVHHLLEDGAIGVDDLTHSLNEQGVSRPLIGRTLGLLRRAGVLDQNPRQVDLAPSKRHLFRSAL